MTLRSLLLGASWLCVAGSAAAQAPSYLLFESGPVRPIALAPAGDRLFVANTPDNHLEIYDIDPTGKLLPAGSVQVGLEPVAVAARSDAEVWVVNHLSDSISIVDVSGEPRVVRTLLVGDEPSDIVFAGPGGSRAFVTAAHRGQNAPVVDGDFDAEGIGRADVYVFDATDLGDSLAGDRLAVLTLFGDKPRGLARNASGSRVYAGIFRSGNRTSVLNQGHVCDTSASNQNNEVVQGPCAVGAGANLVTAPGGMPTPHKNQEGIAAPEVGLIVQQNRDGGTSGQWQDELGRNWSSLVKFSLPDQDVFAIDANASPPVPIGAPFVGVGSSLFHLAVHPTSGKVYVSNTEAANEVRFEGPGAHVTANGLKPVGEPASVRGKLAQARITVLDPSTGSVAPRHLNKHIPYGTLPVPADVEAKSLATPLGIDFSADGSKLYVAAFGSSRVGVFEVAQLDADSFVPNAADHIPVGGGGPSGLLVSGSRLYVTTRFDNSLRVIDLGTQSELQRVILPDPESPEIVAGRPFLYDAVLTGSNGEASCSSCHLFADNDDLAWDLGNPDDTQATNANPFVFPPLPPLVFHPHKGPMTTQSLRGLANMGPQHWRGDRQGDEIAAFEAFNVAFPGLIGRDEGALTNQQMTDFREFALLLRYPPNPIRSLDNALRDPPSGASELRGSALFSGRVTDGVANCVTCHALAPANGHFGGNGASSVEGSTQEFKVPHLRNLYQKVGMFGFQEIRIGPVSATDGPFGNLGPQVRGFGFSHDGSVDTLNRFNSVIVFSLDATEQRDLEAFMQVFPSDLAPIVGQQVTLNPTLLSGSDATAVNARVDLLLQRAGAPFSSEILGGLGGECDVVAQVVEVGGTLPRSYQRLSSALFLPDDGGPAIGAATLRAKATLAGQEVTFTCTTPGAGPRMGVDRDLDLALNGLDNCPGAPNSTGGGSCTAGDVGLRGASCSANAQCGASGFCSLAQEDTDADLTGDACDPTPLPEPSTTVLLAAGIAAVLTLRRAKRAAGPRSGPAGPHPGRIP